MYNDKLPDMSAAYAEIQEKMAKKDHDGDGKIETGKEEYFGARDKAIKKAMKEDSGHDEAMNYGRDEGHDDKELYDLKLLKTFIFSSNSLSINVILELFK